MSRDGSYKDIKFHLLMAVGMFAVAGMVTFRQQQDLSEYCKPIPPPIPPNETLAGDYYFSHNLTLGQSLSKLNMTAAMLSEKPLIQIFASIDRMDYLTKHLAEPECKQYTAWQIFKYNYFIWVACFFIGLQFTHLDNGIF